MKKFSWLLKIFCVIGIIVFYEQAYAALRCYSKMSEVLECFLKYDDGVYKYNFLEEKNDKDIAIRTYLLSSQKWPVNNYADIPTTEWQHQLVFYIPKKISYAKVLLYVNGGRVTSKEGVQKLLPSREQVDYVTIANDNEAIVVELQDTPNQFLFFNHTPVKEDEILAYTYKKVMDDPLKNAYLAGHLPMAKSAVKAMDAIQEILKRERDFEVTGFVLSGASKRGWAIWLAALGDNRVEAIIPIVIDILNVKKSIGHVCQSYGGICPPALMDYEKYGLSKMLHTSAFAKLMEIEDPYNYLKNGYDSKYKSRMAIPKYIINASGDDFFVPDSSQWYFKDLPGDNNHLRYLPNAMHYFKGNPISDSTDSLQSINNSLSAYFYFILNQVALPKVHWIFKGDIVEFTSSVKPSLVKLWVANNKHTRDFRFINSYSKLHLFTKRISHYFFGKICDNCYEEKVQICDCEKSTNCKMQISLPPFKKGWRASFVELHYNIDDTDFVVTTEVNITPDTLPLAKVGGYKEL